MNLSRIFKHLNSYLNQASIDSRLYTLLRDPRYAKRQIGFPYFCVLFLLYTNGAVFTWFNDVKKHPTIIELNRINFLEDGAHRMFSETVTEWIQGCELSSLGVDYLNSLNILSTFQKLGSHPRHNSRAGLLHRIFNHHNANAQAVFQEPSVDDYNKLEGVLDREEQFKNQQHPSLHHYYNHLTESSALSEARLIQFLIQNHVKITLPVIQSIKYYLFSHRLKFMGSSGDYNSILPDFFMLT